MNDNHHELQLFVVEGRGIKFINKRLEAWFNLCADPENDGNNWYAGSATSVLLDGKEELDPFRAELPWSYMGHDRQKRCMQVDEICLYDTAGENPIGSPVNLTTSDYDLQSYSVTSDRVTATVVSKPFVVEEHDSNKRFRLFRTISLHADADMLTEELVVSELNDELAFFSAPPYFTVRYFTYIAYRSAQPNLYRHSGIPSHYFAIGYPWGYGPYPGYGYATDASICELMQPDNRFKPYEEAQDIGTVSWTIGPCQQARGVHLFTRYESDFETRIRGCWKAIPSIKSVQLPISSNELEPA